MPFHYKPAALWKHSYSIGVGGGVGGIGRHDEGAKMWMIECSSGWMVVGSFLEVTELLYLTCDNTTCLSKSSLEVFLRYRP